MGETNEARKVSAEEALALGANGKLEIRTIKKLVTERDLSLAYFPEVAEPCLRIHRNPETAYDYITRGNMVDVARKARETVA